jgi:hypothetical protein
MAVNIALALEHIDFNKINITLVDGMSIDKLKIRYNWIFNATIEDAIIGEDSYGLVWYSGNWICGDWYNGTWYSGNFQSGTWKDGKFYSYKLNKFDILNGNFNIIDKGNQYSVMGIGDGFVEWEAGDFHSGTFGTKTIDWTLYSNPYDPSNPQGDNDITNNSGQTNIWRNGNFYGGINYHTIWYNGNWYNGYMENIQWINGKFYNGQFNGFIWYNGTFLGGDFINGVWKDGVFTTFNANIKSRFGVTENVKPSITEDTIVGETTYNYERCTWKNGDFNNGEFHSGLNVDSLGNVQESGNQKISIWENGNFNNGKWYGGSFENGVWNNGEFLAGYFGTDSTTPIWNNGSFVNGFWRNGIFNNGEFHNGICKNIQMKNGKFGD